MKQISVLIPVYNNEQYIEDCIKSISNQTLQDIEIIIINDGSTDNTKNIIENLQKKDNRIQVINKKNTGYGDSLNTGIQKAKGEYIAIVESDDYIKDTMLETLFEYAKKHNCEITKANFYNAGNKQKEYTSKYFNNTIENITTFPQMILIQPSIWSSLYKKDFLTKNNIKFSTSKGASYQDISFHFISMFLAKGIFFLNMPLYYYRTNNSNSSTHSNDKPFAIYKELKIINAFLKNKVINKEQKTIINIFKYKIMMWNFFRTKNKYNKIILNKIYTSIKNDNLKEMLQNKNLTTKDKVYLNILLKNKTLFYIICIIRKLIKNHE